jgi:hypothetical protein
VLDFAGKKRVEEPVVLVTTPSDAKAVKAGDNKYQFFN